MTETFVYKYLSMADTTAWERRRMLIADRTLYFSEPSTFNDPWDHEIAARRDIRNRLLPDIRIFCLSGERRYDALMFAHYGVSHRGIRLTFAIDEDKALEDLSSLETGKYVNYTEDLSSIDPKDAQNALVSKQKCWEYEAEYRVFASETKEIIYGTEELREVAFGCRMSPDFEPIVRRWVDEGGHSNVRFLKASLSQSRIGFEYEERVS